MTARLLPDPNCSELATLVTNPGEAEALSYVRAEDCRTALARALTEYLGAVSIVWKDGRLLEFNSTQFAWGEPEDPLKYPALVVNGVEPGRYDDTGFSRTMIRVGPDAAAPPYTYVRRASELVQLFHVMVWTTDPEARAGLTAAIEDALDPVDWMSGFRLRVPYYYNAFGSFLKETVDHQDSGGESVRRQRVSAIRVDAHLMQYVPAGQLPLMRPRPVVRIDVPADWTPPPRTMEDR